MAFGFVAVGGFRRTGRCTSLVSPVLGRWRKVGVTGVRMVVAPNPSSSFPPNVASNGTTSGEVAVPEEEEEPVIDRVVCKFGGSSLADSERLKEVTKIIKMQVELSNKYPIVVLSAMGPSTNELLAAGDRALEEGVVDISSVKKRAYEVRLLHQKKEHNRSLAIEVVSITP